MAEIITINPGEHKLMLLRNHDADMEINISEGASLKFFDLVNSVNSVVSEINLTFNFLGEGSVLTMRGRMMGKGSDSVRRNIVIRHSAPQCESDVYYKYVLDGEAQGRFDGRVIVPQDCQKTTSRLLNKNLCLSHDARMQTRPELEIYADDVQCSHGSSIGMLDQDAIFYMQQRGIPFSEAKRLLVDAFINEIQMPRLCVK